MPGRTGVRFLETVLKGVAVCVVLGIVAVYVAAKVHFFRRFTGDFGAYWAEHWPYTAGLAAGVAILWGVAGLARRMGVGDSAGEGQSNNKMQQTRHG
jgi:hypothetical protein